MSEPSQRLSDPRELFLAYLDWYREVVLRKLDGLPQEELRGSRLPSGWSPLEMVKHLAYMERRWIRWGFCGEPVEDPWGDHEDGRWALAPEDTLESLRAFLLEQGEHTRRAVSSADLVRQAPPGPRFREGVPPPALSWILFHVLQEYARHAGHLDVVRELADGVVGE
ncbi:DinB family protein [Nonomuraea sp. NPDC059007]|uniref:DinB family protein n=1 Tax=Nonomuraea sp. NPDC059007 TaxID=3346692 RepID=UPI00369EF000